MAVSGDFWWPSAGIFVAAVVEIFVAADTRTVRPALCPRYDLRFALREVIDRIVPSHRASGLERTVRKPYA
jgi:hypothetical protein